MSDMGEEVNDKKIRRLEDKSTLVEGEVNELNMK